METSARPDPSDPRPGRRPAGERDDARPGDGGGGGGRLRRAVGTGLRRQAAVALALGGGAFLLFHLVAAAPGLVESVYGRAVGPAVAWALARLTAPFPFPVAQVLLAAYVGWLLALAVRGARAAMSGRRADAAESGSRGSAGGTTDGPDGPGSEARSRLSGLARAAGRGAVRLGRDAGVLVVTFYLLWGFHYARPSLEDRTGLPDGGDAGRDELVRLAERSVAATNRAYRAVHGTDDAGSPTSVSDGDHLREALLEGWRRLAAGRGLPDHLGWRYGPAKPFVPDGVLVRLGLGGFYFPWTGEAVVDGGTPASDLVQSIAHEQAHQRGVGPEDEASFMGFLAASRAPDPVARYSALLFAQRHLVAAASSGGRPDLREELTDVRLPGVTRDLRNLYAYWRRRFDPAARVARRMNDAYLKSNRVEGGVASYGLVTRLLVAEAREDGELFSPAGDGAAEPDSADAGGGAGDAGRAGPGGPER
jgi:hypothetical protein